VCERFHFPDDPGRPQTVSSLTIEDVKQYYAKTVRPDLTTIVVIGDVTPEEARKVIEKWFGTWKAASPKPEVELPRVPLNKSTAANVPDPSQLQDSVNLSQLVAITRFDPDYYPLQLANHVLGGGFYATRLYHDLRQVTGYVYDVDIRPECAEDQNDLYRYVCLRSEECIEGQRVDSARPNFDAKRKCHGGRIPAGEGAPLTADSACGIE
jgi:predicted Zn-dependent peptidase